MVQFVPVCIAEESGPATWHQFQKDAGNSGQYQSELPEAYELMWSKSVAAVVASSPVVAEGKVFVNSYTSAESSVKALDIATGNVAWSTPVDRIAYGSWSSPSYHDGMVFTSTGANTTCLDASTGQVLWSFRSPANGASCNGGPTIADGKVFSSEWYENYYYYALDAYSADPAGSELWRFKATRSGGSSSGLRLQATPAYKDGRIYVTSFDYNAPTYQGYVYCVDAATGSEIWKKGLKHNACGSVSVGDNAVYVTTYNFYGDANACALDINSGAILWEVPISRSDSTPAIAYGNVYVSAGYQDDNKVYCINATTGEIVWETDKSEGIGGWTNSIAVADGKVFAGIMAASSVMVGGYSDLVQLDAYTGDILWKTTGGSTSAISGGNIYTIGDDGTVYAYASATPVVDVVTSDVNLPTGIAYPYFGNEITATISNEGNRYVENVYVSLQENGNEVDSLTVSLLGGGCSQAVSLEWIPSGAGDYELTVDAYPTGPVTEPDTSNNAMSISATVISGDADLVPVKITPSAVYAGQSYEMRATVKNMGYSVANSFTIEVREGTTVLATETISSLGPAQSVDVAFIWMSSDIGNAYLTVVADADNTVTEEDETNNQLTQAILVKTDTSTEVLSNTDWSQFQFNVYNNGVTDGYSPVDDFVNLKWKADDFEGNIDIAPVVVGDTVYVVASSGLVYAYDKSDGTTTKWHMDIGEASNLQSSIPAYGDGNLFVATYGGNLYALNSNTGVSQWKVKVTNSTIQSPVTYSDHRVYVADGIVGTDTKYYHCYDDMGTKLWSYEIPDTAGFIWSGAAVVGDYIVFSTQEGKLISLDRKEGTLADEINLNSSASSEISFAVTDPGLFRASVMYNDGYVYATSERGQLTGYVWKLKFDEDTGEFSDDGGWRSDQIFSTSTPAIYNGKIYVGQGEHGETGKLICLSDSTGAELWSYDGVSSGVKSSPVISTYYGKPYIYFTSAIDNGSVYCLDENGELVWEYNPPDDEAYILQGVAISEGMLYFGTDGGYLYCLEGDWNPWNDPDSEKGKMIALNEASDAVTCWQYKFPTPVAGHIISLNEISDIVTCWQYKFPM
jgi:outer membrane protein assembly factor BamB